jgi:hypothetical protein
VILILHGLLVNWYPDLDLHMIRIPCILQRIRICSLLASALYMGATGWLSARAEVGCAAGSWSEWRLFSSLAIGCY